MPIRTQIRLPQISGSLGDNLASAFSFTDGNGAAEAAYLTFRTSNSSESVQFGKPVQLMAGADIIDSNGDARFSAQHGAATLIKKDDGATIITVAADTTFASDIVVSGGKVTLTNGATIDSETSGELKLTEDLVKASGNLSVIGGDIALANGASIDTSAIAGQMLLTEDLIKASAAMEAVGNITAGANLIAGNDLEFSAADPVIWPSQGSGETLTIGAHADGIVRVLGDLRVDGTTTTVNSTEVVIADKNIILANGAGADADIAGAGLTLDSSDGDKTFSYAGTGAAARMVLSENMDLAAAKWYMSGDKEIVRSTASKVQFSLDGAGGELLSLPAADGSANQYLQTNGSGQLAWVSSPAAVFPIKSAFQMAAIRAANSDLSADGNYSVLNVSAPVMASANLASQIDVFVNGQLLQSGSGPYSTDVSAAGFVSGDYLGNGSNSALDFKFSFQLEAGDVVQVMAKTQG